ncbi:MAG TPA: S-layer homology domain-containing protein [Terriglobales bacterium]|nr:S-layer homology domain-containing protein [Terriglobales bacterium]
MKKIISLILTFAALCTCFGSVGTVYAASASFTLSASNAKVNVGDTVVITVDAENVPDFFSYELFLEFDGAKLELIGSPTSLVSGFSAKKVTAGSVQFGCVKSEKKLQSGADVSLCKFTFKIKAAGASSVKLAWYKSYDLDVKENSYTVNKSIAVEGLAGASIITIADAVLNSSGVAQGSVAAEDVTKAFAAAPNIEINVLSVAGANAYGVTLPLQTLCAAASGGKTVKIQTEYGAAILPVHMLSGYGASASDKVELRIARVDSSTLSADARALVGSRPVLDVSLLINGSPYGFDNPDASVTISVPYTPTAAELAGKDHIVLLFLNSGGEIEAVPTGRYDPAAGTVSFKTTHFSKYAVSYIVKTFNDIANYTWANKQIEALASKGIIKGTTADGFSPQSSITRADFVLLLARALGVSAKTSENFSDVNPGAYYASAVAAAKKLGIITGTGDNLFNPTTPITRQDMMTIIYRACRVTGVGLESADASTLSGYADATAIASYAQDSFATLVKNKIVSGSDLGLEPLKHTTRAETAVMLYRLYTLN